MARRKKSTGILELDMSINDIMAIANALKLLSQVQSFRNWLVTKHRIHDDNDYLEGYKFTFNILTRRLHDEIATNTSLGLSEDLVFSRASFTGVPIHKLPNSCEKTILLKNLRRAARIVLTSSNWMQLETAIKHFENNVLLPFIQLKSASVVNHRYSHINLNEAIDYLTMFELYIFFNDTGAGVPHGYPESMLGNTIFEPFETRNDEYLRKAFNGYKYSVQFLWFSLLGMDFENTPLAKLHQAKGWNSFDEYFEQIRTAIIEPLERKIIALLGFAPIIMLHDDAKSIMKPLLKRKPPEPKLNEGEQLEQFFLWYPIELVDASQGTLFNGVPAFVSALSGSTEIKRKMSNRDKTEIVRLMHPHDSYTNLFSYGVLMEVGGLMSDSSGWILFFDCCYDTGSGLQRLEFAERFISEYLDKGLIEVREKQIPKEKFLSLMKDHLISATKEEISHVHKTSEQLRNISDRFDTSRGLLLEFIAYYIYSFIVDNSSTKVEWNYNYLEQQIDILVRPQDRIIFIECTNCADTLIDDSKRIRDKADILWRNPIFREEWQINNKILREYMVFVWDRPSPNIIRQIRQEGVGVRILSEEIKKHPKLVRKSKDKIRHVFDKGKLESTQEAWRYPRRNIVSSQF